MKRRSFLKATVAGSAAYLLRGCATNPPPITRAASPAAGPRANLAIVATPSASFVSPDQTLAGLNSGFDPRNSRDSRHGAYGNWPQIGTHWVQYDWSRPISTNRVDVYWFADGRGLRLPAACRLLYWNGEGFVPLKDAQGLGVNGNKFNTTTFAEITTSKLRLEFDSQPDVPNNSTGILQWKVIDSGNSPDFAPIVKAGPQRVVVLSGQTYLAASIRKLRDGDVTPITWTKSSGPGDVTFADADSAKTTATFSQLGDYTLALTAGQGDLIASDTLRVRVDPPAPAAALEPVPTLRYQINSPLWNSRLKSLIVTWIPHCCAQLSDLHLREGGIANFIEAGKKLSGRPAGRHVGYPFANAYVHNAVESMCVALMVDPQGDQEIIAVQDGMRAKLNEWIPIIIAAQEPDGYLQTRFTLDPRNPPHWDARTRSEHEGYTAGYFLEAAIAHHRATNGQDLRLYNAAKRLADSWCDHLGPAPKKAWYDGHEEIEQALVRLGRFVNETEGSGRGDRYIELARFLLDCRGTTGGTPYDQTYAPVTRQYEALGHAVRAAYLYSAMTDMVAETGDVDYQSAVKSIWDDLVHRKYYVTGGIGSGETSEGFGPDYSLRNGNAYCESCSSCGEVFFQHKMNRVYQDAMYADLYETTLYNAILGSVDLQGQNFYYDNPLESDLPRYRWHVCPCCVGNIPRTLLQLPTWMYSKSASSLYVNLYLGSTVNVGDIAGTPVQMVQTTDYPWSGRVSITVNPAAPQTFAIRLRSPRRDVSELYNVSPDSNGFVAISVNGESIPSPTIENGYAVLLRTWTPGDKIDLECAMKPQTITADAHIAADKGRVALSVGPMIYNLETADQPQIDLPVQPDSAFTTEWNPDLLGGVMIVKGRFAGGPGAPGLTAVPNHVRANRGGRFRVWMTKA